MKWKRLGSLLLALCCAAALLTFAGCGAGKDGQRIEIELVQYKPEAAAYFEMV